MQWPATGAFQKRTGNRSDHGSDVHSLKYILKKRPASWKRQRGAVEGRRHMSRSSSPPPWCFSRGPEPPELSQGRPLKRTHNVSLGPACLSPGTQTCVSQGGSTTGRPSLGQGLQTPTRRRENKRDCFPGGDTHSKPSAPAASTSGKRLEGTSYENTLSCF